MNMIVYNTSMLAGLAMIGSGIAIWSAAAALVVVGTLVIGLTLAAANLSRKG
ncbi:hypothetical protein [Glaciimonas sp. PCH181]|uniref:hypothetical protein n=1 Tax=Glaciimonas sp. PCH181 TaxID=2133943 RepID=UPI0013753270|nr:hypothetical protein [Glaciimonas sp. PCH181]